MNQNQIPAPDKKERDPCEFEKKYRDEGTHSYVKGYMEYIEYYDYQSRTTASGGFKWQSALSANTRNEKK